MLPKATNHSRLTVIPLRDKVLCAFHVCNITLNLRFYLIPPEDFRKRSNSTERPLYLPSPTPFLSSAALRVPLRSALAPYLSVSPQANM